jgi:hypothetical protein
MGYLLAKAGRLFVATELFSLSSNCSFRAESDRSAFWNQGAPR